MMRVLVSHSIILAAVHAFAVALRSSTVVDQNENGGEPFGSSLADPTQIQSSPVPDSNSDGVDQNENGGEPFGSSLADPTEIQSSPVPDSNSDGVRQEPELEDDPTQIDSRSRSPAAQGTAAPAGAAQASAGIADPAQFLATPAQIIARPASNCAGARLLRSRHLVLLIAQYHEGAARGLRGAARKPRSVLAAQDVLNLPSLVDIAGGNDDLAQVAARLLESPANSARWLRAVEVPFGDLEERQQVLRFALQRDTGGNPNFEDVLDAADRRNDLATVRRAVQMGANVNRPNGGAILRKAAKRGDAGLVRLLLEQGLNVNARERGQYMGLDERYDFDVDGRSALMEAAAMGRNEVVDELLHAGAWTEIQDELGYGMPFSMLEDDPDLSPAPTALELAAKGGHIAVVKKILSHDPTTAERAPEALRDAAVKGHLETVAHLVGVVKGQAELHQRALMLVVDEQGHPYRHDRAQDLSGTVELLLGNELASAKALAVAADAGDVATLRLLLADTPEVNYRSFGRDDGPTPLHYAQTGEAVVALLDAGANASLTAVVDGEPRVPLEVAIRRGRREAALELMRRGSGQVPWKVWLEAWQNGWISLSCCRKK